MVFSPSQMDTDIRVTLKIPNFRAANYNRDDVVFSDTVERYGCSWDIVVYPKGGKNSSTETENLSVFLSRTKNTKGDFDVKAFYRMGNNIYYMAPNVDKHGRICGMDNFASRQEIIQNFLEEDGSLEFEFYIHVCPWYPKLSQPNDDLVEIYADRSNHSDVTFSVGGRLFQAHKNILSLRAKGLYDIAEDWENDDDSALEIPSTRADVFEKMLKCVYTILDPKLPFNTPITDKTKYAEDFNKELLVAANKFKFIELKLYVEYLLVDIFLEPENAAELFCFAKEHACGLLEERATKMFKANTEIAMATDVWSSSIYPNQEYIAQLIRGEMGNVIGIRRELKEAGLDVDGTYEGLVNELERHRKSTQGANGPRSN